MTQTFAGIKAFQTRGACASNPHNQRSAEYVQFQDGLSLAQFAAHEKALAASASYHMLSVRDNAVDRAWAARLSA